VVLIDNQIEFCVTKSVPLCT